MNQLAVLSSAPSYSSPIFLLKVIKEAGPFDTAQSTTQSFNEFRQGKGTLSRLSYEFYSWPLGNMYCGHMFTQTSFWSDCETMHLRLGLEHVCQDSSPSQTQIWTRTRPKPTVFQLRSHTWLQDLMKLRFLMSHR